MDLFLSSLTFCQYLSIVLGAEFPQIIDFFPGIMRRMKCLKMFLQTLVIQRCEDSPETFLYFQLTDIPTGVVVTATEKGEVTGMF